MCMCCNLPWAMENNAKIDPFPLWSHDAGEWETQSLLNKYKHILHHMEVYSPFTYQKQYLMLT